MPETPHALFSCPKSEYKDPNNHDYEGDLLDYIDDKYAVNDPMSAERAYFRAAYKIKGRWLEGEKVIAGDAEYAYRYALHVINMNNAGKKVRWPEGEEAIAGNAQYAYLYAMNVIGGRWPEGEEAIATNYGIAIRYYRSFGIKLQHDVY